ncbi:MAG: type II secretion system F family protein [Myxococcales bacterium]
MNEIFQQLGGPVLQIAVFVLSTATISFLLVGLRSIAASREDPIQRRMRRTTQSAVEARSLGSIAAEDSLLDAAVRPIAKVAKPGDEVELAGLKARLSHAGYRSERALYTFLAAKVILCMLGAGAVLIANMARVQPTDRLALYTVVAMMVGFYFPNLWLAGRVADRKSAINHGLPDAMDLLVTCVEAGLGLEGALNRIAGEIRLSVPLLAEELTQAALEMRAGLTRGEAFRRLAQRTGVDELKYLASVIVQAEVFGTSIATSLRVMSEAMRIRRTQTAERYAAAASVKMTIPLVMCILPSLFTFLLGPAVINIARIMVPAMGGQ